MNQFSCTALVAMGRHIPTPFHLALADSDGSDSLRVDAILRIIPGKRIVARAWWKNQTVLAKIFFGAGSWTQSMSRDLQGCTLLRQAGILTPKVISQIPTGDKQGAVLLSDFLQSASSLLNMFENAASTEEQNTIVEMGLAAIAQCHQAGLWQQDMHLGNFMVSQGQVYVLDGDAVMGDGRVLDLTTCLDNLALFFAQFPAAMDEQVRAFLLYYRNTCKIDFPAQHENLFATFPRRVIKARQRRLNLLQRKLFRSSTALRQVKSANRFAVYDRRIHCDAIETIIADPDSLMNNATMLKQGNSSTVAIVQFKGRDLVLKRYNVKGFMHGLKRLFTLSRAHKSWRNAAMLEMLGIATPHACIMIEERWLWLLRGRAWYLSELVEGENLLTQMQHDHSERLLAGNFIDKFRQLFGIMQDYNISHGDMKASNFIMHNDKLYVLDLDAMHRYQSASGMGAALQKDRDRFRRNWDGTPLESAVQQMLGELEPVATT